MILERQTTSLCNVCYKTIPAMVRIAQAGVMMEKACSQHGMQVGVVEPDPVFYAWVRSMNAPSIYDGYFVDVTKRCNLRCQYCYYPLVKQDPAGVFSIGNIVDECASQRHLAPFILTGGEPTTREDIVDLVKAVSQVGPFELLTNGVRLESGPLYDELMPYLVRQNQANLHLSIHDDQTEAWRGVAAKLRADRVTIGSALIVIDSKERFLQALEIAKELSGVVRSVRIKAASRIWAEKKPSPSDEPEKIYVSHMLNWLTETGRPWQVIPQLQNKSVFVNVLFDGMHLMLVAWHDTKNVDLNDIACPPYYRARNGAVLNMVTAMLVNEGMEKGWLHGRKLA